MPSSAARNLFVLPAIGKQSNLSAVFRLGRSYTLLFLLLASKEGFPAIVYAKPGVTTHGSPRSFCPSSSCMSTTAVTMPSPNVTLALHKTTWIVPISASLYFNTLHFIKETVCQGFFTLRIPYFCCLHLWFYLLFRVRYQPQQLPGWMLQDSLRLQSNRCELSGIILHLIIWKVTISPLPQHSKDNIPV